MTVRTVCRRCDRPPCGAELHWPRYDASLCCWHLEEHLEAAAVRWPHLQAKAARRWWAKHHDATCTLTTPEPKD